MKMIELGKTGLTVSEMCAGTLPLGTLQAKASTEDGAAAIRRAIDLGVNFIDTAQAYGTYGHVAHAIAGVQKDLIVASKSHAGNYEDMEKAIYECRKALRRQVIDIFYLHLVKDEENLHQRSWALRAIEDFKKAGAVRAIGATTHTNAGLRAAADCPEIEVVMACINDKGMGIVDGSLEECLQLCGLCRERGKAVIAMKPLAGGHFIGRAAEAINYVRALGEVDAIAVGLLTPEEAEADVAIFDEREIPAGLAASLNAEPKHVIIYESCECCGRCIERCPQGALTPRRHKPPVVDPDKCVLCGYCAEVCPRFAIRVV